MESQVRRRCNARSPSARIGRSHEAKGEFGIPGRRYFRKNNAEGIREYHIHAFVADSEAAREYSRLKRELAKRHPADIEAYMDGKDPFIKAAKQAALAWWRSSRQLERK